jgi:hypothetical protein
MINWKPIATDLGSGAVAGVLDQLVSKHDTKRAATAGVPQLKWTKRFGTYFNYGIPILAVAGVATNYVRGDWATRLTVIGGQLAGREAMKGFQNKGGTAPVYYNPVPQYVQSPNPQPIKTAPVVPIVSPQGNLGIAGMTG